MFFILNRSLPPGIFIMELKKKQFITVSDGYRNIAEHYVWNRDTNTTLIIMDSLYFLYSEHYTNASLCSESVMIKGYKI